MKKTYMSPKVDVIELNNQQQLLAGSTIPMGGSGSADEAEAPGFYF